MHEAGIAQSIIDIALQTASSYATSLRPSKIVLVAVRVGKMAGIDKASLIFAFDALKVGTAASDARLDYIEVPLVCRCLDCGAEEECEGYFVRCTKCGSARVSVISGNELEVSHIDVE